MRDTDMIEAMARALTDDIKTMEFVAEHDGDHDTVRETLRQAIACIRSLTAENEALRRERDEAHADAYTTDEDGESVTWQELCAAERAVRHHNKSRAEASEALVAELREKMERLAKSSADDLRADGWDVAVHNDYRLNGWQHTFWLFTKNGRAIKGEGLSDAEALDEVRRARSELEGQ